MMTITAIAHPNSQKEFVQERGGELHVFVRPIPEGGKANTRVVELIAQHFGIAKTRIKIKTGMTGKRKIVLVDNA